MKSFFQALGFLSLLPVGQSDKSDAGKMTFFFPLAGLTLGILAGAILLFFSRLGLSSLPEVAAVVALLFLTRAFHLDGLADTFDGLGGGFTRERRLEIMRDSAIGTFGAAAIVSVLLLKISALWAIKSPQSFFALALAAGLSRWGMTLNIFRGTYARKEEGLGKGFFGCFSGARCLGSTALIAIAAILLGGWYAALLLPAVALMALGWNAMMNRKLGGQTGDTLGAFVELSETAVLIIWCVAERLNVPLPAFYQSLIGN